MDEFQKYERQLSLEQAKFKNLELELAYFDRCSFEFGAFRVPTQTNFAINKRLIIGYVQQIIVEQKSI